jgi:hypothetical protein
MYRCPLQVEAAVSSRRLNSVLALTTESSYWALQMLRQKSVELTVKVCCA